MTPRIAVIADSPDENWPSMDLVAEMIVKEWQENFSGEVDTKKIDLPLPRVARRVSSASAALNVDRTLGRFLRYPAAVLQRRSRFDFFHVADHSYAQVVHALPASRTGVFCHDLDTFRSVLTPDRERRSLLYNAMMQVTLAGLRRAAVVFHTTRAMGKQLEHIVDPHRLVHAPYGIAADFTPQIDPDDDVDEMLAPIAGKPFVLHVGSSIPRKRIDVLFEVFARLRERDPELRLVQQGASLSSAQKEQASRLGIAPFIHQPPLISQAFDPKARRKLAGLYRRARVVLLPSESEGFGIPIIEALACGARVIASDTSTIREAGGDVTTFVPVGDIDAWVNAVSRVLSNAPSDLERARGLAHAKKFSWKTQAKIILDAYRALASERA